MNKAVNVSQRWYDFAASLLLLAAILTLATRLVATRWVDHLGLTQTLGFFGILAGLALGQSRFRVRWTLIFSTIYGSFTICWQLGMTLRGDKLLWGDRLEILYNRLWIIITQLINRETVIDSLLFLVMMCILFWILGTHAGYTLSRHGNPWWSVLPGGLAIFVIHSFDPLISQRTVYLAVYIFFALMLVARMTFLQNQSRWVTVRTALPPHLGFDFTRFAIAAVTVIVLIAWTIPALGNALPLAQKAWRPVQHAWNNLRGEFDEFFAPLRASIELVSEVYGNSMTLGRGTPLGDTQIFAARGPQGLPSITHLYWRARVYDTYINGQWFSNNLQARNYLPERDDFLIPILDGRWIGTFEIIAVNPVATIYTPSQPLWIDQNALVEFFENPDGTVDLITFRASPTISPGYMYRVQAALDYATVVQLISAGDDYPDWVKERYLNIPTTVTDRTRQLAEEITFGLETPYEKAIAITNYLRKNIEYVEVITEDPPKNQETLDWFLFDLRQGFCNYYATAEVILLRSVGIPARWATGYATGEKAFERETNQVTYTILQRHAHAWPEVYFPGIGWIEFEPTVSQPEIVRLPGDPSDPIYSDLSPEINPEEIERRRQREELENLLEERAALADAQTQQNRMNMVYFGLFLALAGVFVFLVIRYRPRVNLPPMPIILEKAFLKAGLRPPAFVKLWARQAVLPPLTKAYLEINYALRRLKRPPSATSTPTERAELLAQELPIVRKPAHRLVHEYQLDMFSNQPANQIVAIKSAIEIKDRSLKAYFTRLFSRLQRKPISNSIKR